jgi:hypothetical protein
MPADCDGGHTKQRTGSANLDTGRRHGHQHFPQIAVERHVVERPAVASPKRLGAAGRDEAARRDVVGKILDRYAMDVEPSRQLSVSDPRQQCLLGTCFSMPPRLPRHCDREDRRTDHATQDLRGKPIQ